MASRSVLLSQSRRGRGGRRGPLRVQRLKVQPIRSLWTNRAAVIDQSTDRGGAVFFSPRGFPFLYYKQKICSLGDKIPLCPIQKQPPLHTRVIYIRGFVCDSLTELPEGAEASMFCYQVKMCARCMHACARLSKK